MYALIALGLFGVFAYRSFINGPSAHTVSSKLTSRLDRLWEVAQESINERKYLRAERALLTILKVDERSATAYNRLGILYAKQKEYDDAIECFEIAQSLEPSASSLHNVGLIHYEKGNFSKAAQAFEQALDLEDSMPSRYIAYGKVQEKLGNTKRMTEAFEKAVELEPSPTMLQFVSEAYERMGQTELAEKTRAALTHMNTASSSSVRTSVPKQRHEAARHAQHTQPQPQPQPKQETKKEVQAPQPAHTRPGSQPQQASGRQAAPTHARSAQAPARPASSPRPPRMIQ